jgi:hypothetical protein
VLRLDEESVRRRVANVWHVVLRLEEGSAGRRVVMGRAGWTKVAVRFSLRTATPGGDASKGVCSVTHAGDADKR